MGKVDWSQFTPVDDGDTGVDWSQFTPIEETPSKGILGRIFSEEAPKRDPLDAMAGMASEPGTPATPPVAPTSTILSDMAASRRMDRRDFKRANEATQEQIESQQAYRPEHPNTLGTFETPPTMRQVKEAMLTQRAVKDRSLGETAGDTGSAAMKGLAQVANAAAYVGTLGGKFAEPVLDSTNEAVNYWEGIKSDPLKARKEINDLKSKGFFDTIGRVLSTPSTLIDMLADNAAMFLPSALAARTAYFLKSAQIARAGGATGAALEEALQSAATKAGLAAGSAMEGSDAGTQARQQVLSMSSDDLMTNSESYRKLIEAGLAPNDAKREVAWKAGAMAFAIQAPVAALLSHATGAARFEAGVATKGGGAVGGIRDFARHTGGELVEETGQEGGAQLASNIGVRTFGDKTTPLMEDVEKSSAYGALLGPIQGGAYSAGGKIIDAMYGLSSDNQDLTDGIEFNQSAIDRQVRSSLNPDQAGMERVGRPAAMEVPKQRADYVAPASTPEDTASKVMGAADPKASMEQQVATTIAATEAVTSEMSPGDAKLLADIEAVQKPPIQPQEIVNVIASDQTIESKPETPEQAAPEVADGITQTEFSGEIEAKHGSKNQRLTKFLPKRPANDITQSYFDNVAGDDVVYLDEEGNWQMSPEQAADNRFVSYPVTYATKTKFDKAFVLTPDSSQLFADKFFPDKTGPREIIKATGYEMPHYPDDVAERMMAQGYDGLIVRGFSGKRSEWKPKFINDDLAQNQIIAFKPENVQIIERINNGTPQATPAPVPGDAVAAKVGLVRAATPQEAVASEKATPMLDLNKAPTGWKRIPLPNGNGTLLVSYDGKQSAEFPSANQKSGTEGMRANAKAQAFAIDNPYSGEIPQGELVATPIFKQSATPTPTPEPRNANPVAPGQEGVAPELKADERYAQEMVGRGPKVGETIPWSEGRKAIVRAVKTYDNKVGGREWKSDAYRVEIIPANYASLPGTRSSASKFMDGLTINNLVRNGYQAAQTVAPEPKIMGKPSAEMSEKMLKGLAAGKSPSPAKVKAQAELDRRANTKRETITPAEDKNIGKNAAGELLYERADGSRYRMHADRPDFGGDLAVVENAGSESVNTSQEAQGTVNKAVIRGEEMSVGDDVHWMSGGTWDGVIKAIKPRPSGNHYLTIAASNGKTVTLDAAEHYSIALGRSEFYPNKPSNETVEKSVQSDTTPAPETGIVVAKPGEFAKFSPWVADRLNKAEADGKISILTAGTAREYAIYEKGYRTGFDGYGTDRTKSNIVGESSGDPIELALRRDGEADIIAMTSAAKTDMDARKGRIEAKQKAQDDERAAKNAERNRVDADRQRYFDAIQNVPLPKGVKKTVDFTNSRGKFSITGTDYGGLLVDKTTEEKEPYRVTDIESGLRIVAFRSMAQVKDFIRGTIHANLPRGDLSKLSEVDMGKWREVGRAHRNGDVAPSYFTANTEASSESTPVQSAITAIKASTLDAAAKLKAIEAVNNGALDPKDVQDVVGEKPVATKEPAAKKPTKGMVPVADASRILGSIYQRAAYNKWTWERLKSYLTREMEEAGVGKSRMANALEKAMTEYARNANGRLGYPNANLVFSAMRDYGLIAEESPEVENGKPVAEKPAEGNGLLNKQQATDNMSGDPAPADAERVQAAIEGGTVIGAAEYVRDNSDNPTYRLIAEKVIEQLHKFGKSGQTFSLHVAHEGTHVPNVLRDSRGWAWRAFGSNHTEIWLQGADMSKVVGMSHETILHELIHAVTQAAYYYGKNKALKDSTIQHAVDSLFKIQEAVATYISDRSARLGFDQLDPIEHTFLSRHNAMRDPDEVLAWGLTNPSVQRYLEAIPYESGSLWTKFVDTIRQLLGLPVRANTALSELLKTGETLLNANAYPMIEIPQFAGTPHTHYNQTRGLLNTSAEGNGNVLESRSPTYYSQLARSIESAPDKIFTSAGQVKLWLIGNASKLGIKSDELQWSGIIDYLTLMGKQKVSKADVLGYLKGNGVQVEEVVLGEENNTSGYYSTDPQWGDTAEFSSRDDAITAAMSSFDLSRQEAEEFVDETDESNSDRPVNTKFSTYTPPGGKPGSYRELLLTLPKREGALTKLPDGTRAIQLQDGDWWVSNEDGTDLTKGSFSSKEEAVAVALKNINAGRFKAYKDDGANFQSSHFDQLNILAHLRVDEVSGANGERLLRVIEIQSDHAQKGRRVGFRDDAAERTAKNAALAMKPAFDAAEERRTDARAVLSEHSTRLLKSIGVDNYSQIVGAGDRRADLTAQYNKLKENDAAYIAAKREFDTSDDEVRRIAQEMGDTERAGSQGDKAPSAPFVQDTGAWVALAVKKAINFAAENGMDGVVLATGQQNADFYDLSKSVDTIGYQKRGDNFNVTVWGKDGEKVWQNQSATAKEVEDTIGKEILERMSKEHGRSEGGLRYLEGVDLKVGGEGMLKFYGTPQTFARDMASKQPPIVPVTVNNVLRQIKAETKASLFDLAEIPESEKDNGKDKWEKTLIGFKITDSIRNIAMQGMPLFKKADNGQTSETEGSLPLPINSAARITNETPETIRAALSKAFGKSAIASLEKKGLLKIHADASTLPSDISLSSKGVAVWDGETAHLISNRMNAATAKRELLHEIGTHYNLDQMLGKKGFSALTSRIRKMHEYGDKTVLEAYRFVHEVYPEYSEDSWQFMQETLAHIGQDANIQSKPWWKEMIAAVRRWLVQLGYGGFIKDIDIQDMVLHSLKVAARESREATGLSIPGDYALEQKAGQPAYKAVDVESPEFRRWFGDSKVVDDDGKALRVFHGTGANISAFDNTKAREGMDKNRNGVAWFTTAPEVADTFAGSQRGESVAGIKLGHSNIVPVYLRIENPYTDLQGEYARGGGLSREEVAALKANGYDGVHWPQAAVDLPDTTDQGPVKGYYRNRHGEAWGETEQGYPDQWAAFEPSQVKSAISNTGAFGDTGNILESRNAITGKNNFPMPPSETKTEAAQRTFQDAFNRFRVVQDWMKGRGITINDKNNVYNAEIRMHGRFANKAQDFREGTLEPLIKEVQKAGFTKAQIDTYLHAQHAEERNIQIAKINPKMPDGGSGMKTATARAILAAADPKLKALANKFQKITAGTKQILRDSGILTPEMVAAWDKAYSQYVPLKGGEETGTQQGAGKGYSVNGKQKRALGHGERLEYIVENIARDRERALLLAEHNEVGKHLLALALDLGNDDIISIGKPEKRGVLMPGKSSFDVQYHGSSIATFTNKQDALTFIRTDGRAGYAIVESKGDPAVQYMATGQLGANEALVYVGGHAIRVQINDDILAREYKKLGVERVTMIFEIGREVNTWLSKAYTGYNPEFILRNIRRDLTTGLVNVTADYGGTVAGRAAKLYLGSLMEATYYSMTGKASPMVDLYRKHGGNVGAAYLSDIERIGQDIKHNFDRATGVIGVAKEGRYGAASRVAFEKTIGGMMGWIEHLNAGGENGMRLAVFKALIGSGKSPEEAAVAAKGMTLNFNKKGEIGSQMGAMWLFYNPAVQDAARLTKTLLKSDHKAQAWAIVGSLAMFQFLSGLLQYGDDDDGEYRRIPQQIRMKNFIIRTGPGTYLTWDVPFGFGWFFGIGNAAYEAYLGVDKQKIGIHLAAGFLDNFSPIGNPVEDNGEILPANIAPFTPFKALAQFWDNKTNFGNPIMPDNKYAPNTPDHLRMWKGTKGGAYDQATQWLNDMTGGTKTRPGAIDVSPETLKWMMNTIGGGTAIFMGDTLSLAVLGGRAALTEDRENVPGLAPEIREIPIVRGVVKKESIQWYRTQFYEAQKEALKAKEAFNLAWKEGDTEAFDKVGPREKGLQELAMAVSFFQESIKWSRDREVAIQTDKERSEGWKRNQLDIVEKEEMKLYKDFFAISEEIRKR